jgi:hypothetical protein
MFLLLQVGEEGREGLFALEGLDEVMLPVFWVYGDGVGVAGAISVLYNSPTTQKAPLGFLQMVRILPIRRIRNIDYCIFHDFLKVFGIP